MVVFFLGWGSVGDDSINSMCWLSGKPDPPYDLQFVNATHNSITIRWKPGFNGGLDQSFRVRYKPTEARGYIYVDVSTPVSTLFTITGHLCFVWGWRDGGYVLALCV